MHEDPEQHWTELEHTPMRRWSYSAVRAGLIGLGILLAELTLRDHIGWPAWLRWLAYGTAVFVLRRLMTPPDWRPGVHDPDDTTADLDSPVARTRTRAPEP